MTGAKSKLNFSEQDSNADFDEMIVEFGAEIPLEHSSGRTTRSSKANALITKDILKAYSSFTFNNIMYSIGECVYLQNDEDEDAPLMMKITGIVLLTRTRIMLKGRWLFSSFSILNKKKMQDVGVDLSEVLISTDEHYISFESIIGTLKVVNQEDFAKEVSTWRPPKKGRTKASDLFGRTYYCNRKIDTKTSKIYSMDCDAFDSKNLNFKSSSTRRTLKNGSPQNDESSGDDTVADSAPKRQNKLKETLEQDASSDSDFEGDKNEEMGISSESEVISDFSESDGEVKKIKAKISRPRKRIRRILGKKKGVEFKLSSRKVEKSKAIDDFAEAEERLHASVIPERLPGRVDEYAQMYEYIYEAIEQNSSFCLCKGLVFILILDVYGIPGTGKTATSKSVIRDLQKMVDQDLLDPFEFVEINGMRLSEPAQAYTALWEGLTGNRVSPQHAEELLSNRFKTPNPNTKPCVVLMDELDLLVTKKQDVVYNFFDWPNQPNSHLIVIGIANTMDLPDRAFSNKVASRLGNIRLPFTAYNRHQMVEVIEARLEGLTVFEPNCIELLTRLIAASLGDARLLLDTARRAVQLFRARKDRDQAKLVADIDITTAQKQLCSSSDVKAISAISFQMCLFLLSCVKQTRILGISELLLKNIIDEHTRFSQTYSLTSPSISQFHGMISYLAQYNMIEAEMAKSGLPHQKIRLALQQEDIFLAIRSSKVKVKVLNEIIRTFR